MTRTRFHLKIGWQNPNGQLLKSGRMRLATAHDDLAASDSDPEQQILIILARLIELDPSATLTPAQIGELFILDFFDLQELYYQLHPHGIYSPQQIYRETALIAYHFHWSLADIWQFTHQERQNWINEINNLLSLQS